MEKKLKVIFLYQDGTQQTCEAVEGENILQVARRYDVPIEGACEGALACSTCHVIIDEEHFVNDIAKRSDDEEDILDFANGVQKTSRLGCQVVLNQEHDGIIVKVVSSRCCGAGCCSA